METAEAPRSWQEAFQSNTIPVVRAIEKQLSASANRDRERLRALVGGSYRELLSTAEEIVSLDGRTRNTEAQISHLSQQCKPPQQQTQPRPVATSSFISSQLRLLSQCITSASTAFQGRHVLLCAQLTVIARLLLKSVSEHSSPPKSIEHSGDKIASLRRRLLRLIDARLAHPGSDVDVLVQAICAYCLITSTSSGDAVKHFREVRLEKLRQRSGDQERGPVQIKEDCRYLMTSATRLRSLLGRSVNDSLAVLQKQPILQDRNIIGLETLDVDRLSALIPKDILTFTPYIKRVLLKKDEVQQISQDWVNNAGQAFVEGLEMTLANTKSLNNVLTLRKDLLSVILPSFFTSQVQGILFGKVREATNARVLELCTLQVEGLMRVGQDMITADGGTISSSSLWATSLVMKTPGVNGNRYAEEIQTNHLGLKSGLGQSIKRLKRWAKEIVLLQDQFDALGSNRWQDLLEEPDDEDEAVARKVLSQLSEEDPAHFRDATRTSLHDTVTQFNELMQSAITQTTPDEESDASSKIARIIHLLRATRESAAILAVTFPDLRAGTHQIVEELQDVLAECVIEKIQLTKESLSFSTGVAAGLEDLPSVQAFKLLRNICRAMSDAGGTDIWSAAAVSIFKGKLRSRIIENEEKPGLQSNDFDNYYIRAALGDPKISQPDSSPNEAKSKAIAYWHRTRLLFGPLS